MKTIINILIIVVGIGLIDIEISYYLLDFVSNVAGALVLLFIGGHITLEAGDYYVVDNK